MWQSGFRHKVTKPNSVYDDARGASDDEVLDKAYAENWVLITNDKDFGELIYREQRPNCVVFLRLTDERSVAKIAALQQLLNRYADRLSGSFVVVSETQVRFGKPDA